MLRERYYLPSIFADKYIMQKSLLILQTRKTNFYSLALANFLRQKGIDSIIIEDKKSEYSDNIFYYDTQKLIDISFQGLHGLIKRPTAIDKTYYHIMEQNPPYDFFYIMEDDVFCNNFDTFANCIQMLNEYSYDLITFKKKSKEEDKNWTWWKIPEICKEEKDIKLYHSFNPFYRISYTLADKIIDFYKHNRCLYFQEILITTTCEKHNLSSCDMFEIKDIPQYFGTFGWKPNIGIENIVDDKIFHPCKFTILLNSQNAHKLIKNGG